MQQTRTTIFTLDAYLKSRELEAKHQAMRRAAADPAHRAMLRTISEEFRHIDAEGLPEADY